VRSELQSHLYERTPFSYCSLQFISSKLRHSHLLEPVLIPENRYCNLTSPRKHFQSMCKSRVGTPSQTVPESPSRDREGASVPQRGKPFCLGVGPSGNARTSAPLSPPRYIFGRIGEISPSFVVEIKLFASRYCIRHSLGKASFHLR